MKLTILILLKEDISIKLKELIGTINQTAQSESSCQVKYKSNTQFLQKNVRFNESARKQNATSVLRNTYINSCMINNHKT